MTTARVVLPPNCTQGSIRYRRRQDRSRGVDILVPADVTVEFVSPSAPGTQGEAVVDNSGVKFTLEK
jgi:hypothetical protein